MKILKKGRRAKRRRVKKEEKGKKRFYAVSARKATRRIRRYSKYQREREVRGEGTHRRTNGDRRSRGRVYARPSELRREEMKEESVRQDEGSARGTERLRNGKSIGDVSERKPNRVKKKKMQGA